MSNGIFSEDDSNEKKKPFLLRATVQNYIISIAIVAVVNSALAFLWCYYGGVSFLTEHRSVHLQEEKKGDQVEMETEEPTSATTLSKASAAPNTSVKLQFYNQCPFTVWPGIQAAGSSSDLPENGGFRMNSYETRHISVPAHWTNGTIWARVRCNQQMKCESGSCGNKLKCGGAGGIAPITTANFNLGTDERPDEYYVSLLQGYNVVITIEPMDGANCTKAGVCHGDYNPVCPEKYSKRTSRAQWKYGCITGCTAERTDELCCRGQFANKESCERNEYVRSFKHHCETAKSHPFDQDNTFTCTNFDGKPGPKYRVTFCG